MRALFQEKCRNRIQITIGVRRLKEEFIETSSMVTQVKDEKLGGGKGGGT